MNNTYEVGRRERESDLKPTELEEAMEDFEAWKKAIRRSIIQFLIFISIAIPLLFWFLVHLPPKYIADDYNAMTSTYGYLEQAGRF